MNEQRVVVIGASAGGVEALLELARGLSPDFAAPICVVLHIPADSPSLMASLMDRRTPLKAVDAQEGAKLEKGTIYVAQPDRHLIIGSDRTLFLPRGPRENRHRPAIDPLFRSAALTYGSGAIGVILSGSLDDGTAGMLAIKRVGGTAIVQSPKDALYSAMPQSVVENVDVDTVVPLAGLAAALDLALSKTRLAVVPRAGLELMEIETKISEMDEGAMTAENRPGQPSAYSCPDCGGVLWEIADGKYDRFRCRVGHAYSPESMLGAQADQIEEALWSALKTLEESAALAKRLAAAERERGHEWMVTRFEERESNAHDRAEVIRKVLTRVNGTVPVEAQSKESSR